MAKYIELIDKYEVRRGSMNDYNPPSYIWIDNIGEVVRCIDCKHNSGNHNVMCDKFYGSWMADDFCSYGEKRDDVH